MFSADINCFLFSEHAKSYLKLSFTKQQIGRCCRVAHTYLPPPLVPLPSLFSTILGRCLS